MKCEMRRSLASQTFEAKIAKVGELIRLTAELKAQRSRTTTEDDAVLARLGTASAQLDAGKGVPIERVRENVREWAASPKNSKK